MTQSGAVAAWVAAAAAVAAHTYDVPVDVSGVHYVVVDWWNAAAVG